MTTHRRPVVQYPLDDAYHGNRADDEEGQEPQWLRQPASTDDALSRAPAPAAEDLLPVASPTSRSPSTRGQKLTASAGDRGARCVLLIVPIVVVLGVLLWASTRSISPSSSPVATAAAAPGMAAAHATRFTCSSFKYAAPDVVTAGDAVQCQLHFFDALGQPVDEPPQTADGLHPLKTHVRALGVAREPVIQPHVLFGVHGVCGFATAADAPGRAGLELRIGGEMIEAWIDVQPVMS